MTTEKLSIQELSKQYDEITSKISIRWQELTSRKGYMYSWSIIGNNVRIIYEVPLGGSEAWSYHDMIPIKCFEASLEEAKIILINAGKI
jgi:hypothetical protein